MLFERTVLKIYKKKLLRRLDGDGSVYYFSKEDFPGLMSEDISFLGDKGQRLCGHFYFRGERRSDRLIMLDHGMGFGHVAYMREIDEITRRGYTVFTYDHTGTRSSKGENIGGFSQSLCDLDRAVKFVRSKEEYKDTRIAVIGHSWGGFSTLNIAALHPDISHVVALAPFISPRAIQEQVMRGVLRFYRKSVYKLESEAFPDYAHFDGRESLRGVPTRALIIHSRDDRTCRFDEQFERLKEALGDERNVEFLALDGKGHHPHYSLEAVRSRSEYNAALKERRKKKELQSKEELDAFVKSYDWYKMTEQDKDVWNRIFEFLEK
ncbi:MAG: alpha/beta fold hydrolase [Clostridia bacterium]|nr:alpha/beta fold hydrolase [Clostridia bacterium]